MRITGASRTCVKSWFRGCLALLVGVLLNPWLSATEVRVATAANFAGPMAQLASMFQQTSGHRVIVALGSTGALKAQIRHGAPFDVFVAGDAAGPAAVVQAGLGVQGTRFTYAHGRLVLWSRDAGRVDAAGEVLRRRDWQRLAIANPVLAPYGKAAMETLDRLGVRSSVRSRIVQGENIAQAYQFVASGNAQLGFVALSQVMTDGRISRGSAWVVPQQWHSTIAQDAVLLQRGRDNPAAIAWLEFLRSAPARRVMQSYGYEFPSATGAP